MSEVIGKSASDQPVSVPSSTAGEQWAGVTFLDPVRGYGGNTSVDVMTSNNKGAFCNYNRPLAEEIVRRWNTHADMYEALVLAVGALIDVDCTQQDVIQRCQLALAKAEGR